MNKKFIKKNLKSFFLLGSLNILNIFSLAQAGGNSNRNYQSPIENVIIQEKPIFNPLAAPLTAITYQESIVSDDFSEFYNFFEENQDHLLETIFLQAILDLNSNQLQINLNNNLENTLYENKEAFLNEFKESKNFKHISKNSNKFKQKTGDLIHSISINPEDHKNKFFGKKTTSQKFKNLFEKHKKFLKKNDLFKSMSDKDLMELILKQMKNIFTLISDSSYIQRIILNNSVKDSTPKKEDKEILKLNAKILDLLKKIYNVKNFKPKKVTADVSLWNKYKKPAIALGTAAAIYGASALADKYGSGKTKELGGTIYRNINEAGKKATELAKKGFDKTKNFAKEKTNSLKSKFSKNNKKNISGLGANEVFDDSDYANPYDSGYNPSISKDTPSKFSRAKNWTKQKTNSLKSKFSKKKSKFNLGEYPYSYGDELSYREQNPE